MAFPHRIIHAHVRRNNKKFTPGHWFYDVGPDYICAYAGLGEDRKWYLNIHSANPHKPLAKTPVQFDSLEEVKRFLSEHFECPVVEGKLPSRGW